MAINPPFPKDTRSRLADWLEVEVLVRPRAVATRGDVLRLFDFIEDESHDLEIDESTGEPLEPEILEEAKADCANEVLHEIEYRARVLEDDYPFSIEIIRDQWRLLKSPISDIKRVEAARACYLFCLLTSAIRDDRIVGIKLSELRICMANYFQDIATDAAAGVLNGKAISFGSPRPNGLGFRPALDDLSKQIRVGRPLASVPSWSSGQEKDAGVDVVAWRDFRDLRPAKPILLGQVASGHGWPQKSVKNDIYRFFAWFSVRPSEHYIPSIFIPFPLYHNCERREGFSFSEIAFDKAWHLEQGFGLVIDRLRIVELAASRLADSNNRNDTSTLKKVKCWMKNTLEMARESE